MGLADVLIGSLGLAGLFMLAAVLLAALFAGGLFWWRSRSQSQELPPSEDLHIV